MAKSRAAVPSTSETLVDPAAKPNTASRLEYELLHPAINQLLHKVMSNKAFKEIFTKAIQSDEINMGGNVTHQLVGTSLHVLEKNLDILTQSQRGIAEAILAVRQRIRELEASDVMRINYEEKNRNEEMDPGIINTFRAYMAAIIRRHPDVNLKELRTHREIPTPLKLELLFEPFERLAHKLGVEVHHLLNSRMRRFEAAEALTRLSNFDQRSARSIFSQVSLGQREPNNEEGAKRSIWHKYQDHKAEKLAEAQKKQAAKYPRRRR